MTRVRHVLLDADGVLQEHRGAWQETATGLLGDRTDEFLALLPALEAPSLAGEGDFQDALARALEEQDFGVDAEELYRGLWLGVEAVPETVALVHALREAGLGVHLGTNQHDRRAAYMTDVLGYDVLFDSCFYSCRVGVAKPDPDFFTRVAGALEVAPGEVLFIDDLEANVRGAREAGMVAEVWTVADGPQAIRSILSAHGATLPA